MFHQGLLISKQSALHSIHAGAILFGKDSYEITKMYWYRETQLHTSSLSPTSVVGFHDDGCRI